MVTNKQNAGCYHFLWATRYMFVIVLLRICVIQCYFAVQ